MTRAFVEYVIVASCLSVSHGQNTCSNEPNTACAARIPNNALDQQYSDDALVSLVQTRVHVLEKTFGEQRLTDANNLGMECQGNPQTCMLESEQKLWKQAVLEAGMSAKDISKFGRSVVKFPKSFVQRMFALKNSTALKHTYNLVGSMKSHFIHHDSHNNHKHARQMKDGRRQWAIDFAKINFTSHDIFVCTQCEEHWEVLGGYDKTKELGDLASHWIVDDVDFTYWETMMSSKFTLCPGGDAPYSRRAYEAALAGSICVIKSSNDDWMPNKTRHRFLQPVFDLFKYVVADEPHVYDKLVVDHNLRIFIRYLTFIEGDNVPL